MNPHILVVDDEQNMGEFLEAELGTRGFTVNECCFDCTVNPGNPYPAVCSLWTPG